MAASDERTAKLEAENIELRKLLREIVDDASPCTTACNLMVEERLIRRAAELLGDMPDSGHTSCRLY